MWRSRSVSPDGNFLLCTRTVKPFSLACPESRFGVATEVVEFGRSKDDNSLQGVASRSALCERPLQENIPSIFDVTYRRTSIVRPKTYRNFDGLCLPVC